MTDGTPTIFVIGAGAMATALATELRRRGAPVLGLWGRRIEPARRAGDRAGVLAYGGTVPLAVQQAEVVLIAVRDHAIPEVAGMLVGGGHVGATQVLLHCAGALTAADGFAAVAERVRGIGVMHPMRAVTDARTNFDQAVFGIQGDTAGCLAAQAVVRQLGGSSMHLGADQMARYHAAAAMASNLVVAVLDAAVATLVRAGVDEPTALHALSSLAGGAIASVAAQGISRGLTGPVKRGDWATVERHLASLRTDPTTAETYRLLSHRAVEIAARAGLEVKAQVALRDVLGERA